jgi:inositol-phosphate phosphatase/L-galactose 1-phosphate phosphatase/histidinol-phosphatase
LISLPAEYLSTATDAIDAARTVVNKHFRTRLHVETKLDKSPVTVADREIEAVMQDLILCRHPDHGFFGEEGGDQSADKEWRWIIDPIDGTKSFATGKPTFGTLVALLYGDVPVIGIIDHAMLNERWIGVQGQPTTLNGEVCEASDVTTLEQATIYATTPDMFTDQSFEQYSRLSQRCKFRAFGGDCYCYGLVASGYTDLVCEADLKPYDYFALIPVIEGAGGRISDWQGKPLAMDSGNQVIASANQGLHQVAVEQLNL